MVSLKNGLNQTKVITKYSVLNTSEQPFLFGIITGQRDDKF